MVQIRGKMKEVKKALADRLEESTDNQTMQIRAKFMDRWAELSNCPKDENGNYDYSKIDYDNEFIKLEWWLCDPRILMKVTDDKYRARGIMMLPEDVRETFYKQGPGNDRPYCEVYMGMSKIKHTVKNLRKEKKI